MAERGIDISGQASKGLGDLPPGVAWDFVVTMGCGDACPALPARHRLSLDLPDPIGMEDPPFRRVRDEIERRVSGLLAGPHQAGAKPRPTRASGGPRSARSGGWRCPCSAGPAQPAPRLSVRGSVFVSSDWSSAWSSDSRSASCTLTASTLSRARPISLRLLHRPSHAACGGRCAPDRAGAHRRADRGTSRESSPRSRSPPASSVHSPAPPRARRPARPGAGAPSARRPSGAYLARSRSLSSSRCSRPSCCRRIRKALSSSPGRESSPLEGLLRKPPSACAPANPRIPPPAVVGRRFRRLARKGAKAASSSGSRTSVPVAEPRFAGLIPVHGDRGLGDRGEPDRLLRRIHPRLPVDEPHLGRTEQHRDVDERGPRGSPPLDPGEVLRDRGRQKRPRNGFDGPPAIEILSPPLPCRPSRPGHPVEPRSGPLRSPR